MPCEEVEQEYWKDVIDLENTVVVKYGADLAVSKVCFFGIFIQREVIH